MRACRKFAIMAVVALWSAGLYALVWGIVSCFVPATTISHFYDGALINRQWGILFVPLYFEIIVAFYLWIAMPLVKMCRFLIIPLVIGLAGGVICSLIYDMASMFYFQSVLAIAGLGGLIITPVITIQALIRDESIEEAIIRNLFLIFFLMSLILGFVVGLGFVYSPILIIKFLFCALSAEFIGLIFGVIIGIFITAFFSLLFWLHKVALGLNRNKKE